MKAAVIASLSLCALMGGSLADKPKVTHAMIKQVEDSLDKKLQALWSQDPQPVEVLGLTRGVYLTGYGVVFTGEVNTVLVSAINPFHQTIKPEEIKRTHDKKVLRIPELKKALQTMLVDSAATLDSVPGDDQIALGISLFYWNWEDRAGLPAEIVVHAAKRTLLQAKSGGAAPVISVEEFY